MPDVCSVDGAVEAVVAVASVHERVKRSDHRSRVDDAVVYGVHAVLGVIASTPERIKEIWYQAGQRQARLRSVIGQAREAGIRLCERERVEIEGRLGKVRHQGVVAFLTSTDRSWQEADLESLIGQSTAPPLVLVLDGVQDPHNLGACLRTANAAGALAVIVPRDRAVGFTPVVRKVACGAAETVPLIRVSNLSRCLRRLKGLGLWLAGATAEADGSIYEADLTGPLALILGAEGKGLRRMTRSECDLLVAIPLSGSVASLNVSVAAGVCLFEAVRQRASAPRSRQNAD